MAYVQTDRAHYEGIASALRSLHDGEETYTPAQMAEYLSTQGVELKPENIAEGVTIFGVTGTMRYPLYDEWPDGIPPEPEFDEVAKGIDPNAAKMDKMLLMDDKGNVTVGYMSNTSLTNGVVGIYDYNGAAFPKVPAWNESAYPYACLFVTYSSAGAITSAKLYCMRGQSGYDPTSGYLCSNGSSWAIYDYSASTGQWNGPTYGSSSAVYSPHGVATPGLSQELIWANKDVKKYHGYANGTAAHIGSEVVLAGSTPTTAKFTITAYNYRTTDFRAIGWIRVAYHTTGQHAGQYTVDDFRSAESGGSNFIQNVRWCSRASLSYMGTTVWPQGPVLYDYKGNLVPVSTAGLSITDYPYVFIRISSGRAYAYATATAMKMNGTRVVKDSSGSSFDYIYRPLTYASGKPAKFEYDGNYGTAVYGTIAWSNYNIYNTTSGIGLQTYTPTTTRKPNPILYVGYNFNGDVLPSIKTIWDKDAYPYCFMMRSGNSAKFFYTTKPLEYGTWTSGETTYTYPHMAVNPGEVAQLCVHTLSDSGWDAGSLSTYDKTEATTVYRVYFTGEIFWTNTDIPNIDTGGIYLAATEPVRVNP